MSGAEQTTLPRSEKILGTSVACVDYAEALRVSVALARSGRPAAVSACNTHLIALARSEPSFHRVMADFDLVVPDGFPLIWRLNAKGAKLGDRVYGPYLMKYVLEQTPAPWKHFFFGGTPECLSRLVSAAKAMQPNIDISGVLSPPFRAWTEEDEADFAKRIQECDADFIWVALGGERQERWIARHMGRHKKGVFFAVGDAFELLAGGRPFAPAWMQRHGLTWLYRLAQEPRRLWARYFKFNSLFLYYLFRDGLLGTPREFDGGKEHPHVAFLGSRGVPARYSGFEVVVEQLGARLAERGYPVTVYNRTSKLSQRTEEYRGMRTITLPTISTKSLDTITHTTLSAMHAVFQRYDVIYLCGVGNAAIGGFLRFLGFKVIINVDGADFRRAKWGSFARIWLRMSERWATRMADKIIADNHEIVSRYQREYHSTPLYLSYGSIIRTKSVKTGELERWKLTPRGYILFVSRLSPENQADLLLKAFSRYKGPLKLVICGAANYEHAHYQELLRLADDRVIFTGARYNDGYLELSQNAAFFVMPADIEATRLVLLDQMGMGTAILYKNCAATREVLGDAGESFGPDNPEEALAEKIEYLGAHPERCEELGRRAQTRARTSFDWELVVNQYEELLMGLGIKSRSRQRKMATA